MSQPPSTSTLAAASSQVTHANWVRVAETTLQRLQADIDKVHLRILAGRVVELTFDSDDTTSSHEDSTGARVIFNLDKASTRDRLQEINRRIMLLLQQVWYFELHGLIGEHMQSLGLRIMVAINDWEMLKVSIGEDALPEDAGDADVVDEGLS